MYNVVAVNSRQSQIAAKRQILLVSVYPNANIQTQKLPHFDFVLPVLCVCLCLRERINSREMEMDGEKIGMVLVRASELRSKIANCIHNSTAKTPNENPIEGEDGQNGDEADAEADALLNICDAFDSLESQLNSLQTLQQQQQYEREAVIADIENSRKMLLKKLGEYKGEHMNVIQEAEVFASTKVEEDYDLLLPPYPTRGQYSLGLDNGNLSRFTRKLAQNGYSGHEHAGEPKKCQTQRSSNKLWAGLRFLVHSTAKSMLTLVGVISILNLAGFEPRISKKGNALNVLTLFQQSDVANKKLITQCPPGKVPVIEDGEIRCIVKERVEIPFDSVAENPDVNYGCG